MTTTTKPTEAIEDRPSATTVDEIVRHARETAGAAADAAVGAAEQVTARLPEAAGEVDRIIRSGSDDTLRLVTAAAIGVSVGLFTAGASRLLVLVSLLPAAMVAMVLAGRRSV
jgi:hypothetical protein